MPDVYEVLVEIGASLEHLAEISKSLKELVFILRKEPCNENQPLDNQPTNQKPNVRVFGGEGLGGREG